jgi:hypothetical protein
MMTMMMTTTTMTITLVMIPPRQSLEGGQSYFPLDFSMSCNSRAYFILRWYAAIATVLYPIGVPVSTFA